MKAIRLQRKPREGESKAKAKANGRAKGKLRQGKTMQVKKQSKARQGKAT
jgi:hypothetical protein